MLAEVDLEVSFEHLKNEPNLLERYMKHLSNRVARDENTKRAIFMTAISAYSEDPQNLFLRGPSSIGKSYITREVLKYFPPEDVWFLGGLSPTALIHLQGKLIDENGKEIDIINDKPRKEDYKDENGKLDVQAWREARRRWNERLANSHYEINLSNKILVFLEAPHVETFFMLRPILSHDVEEVSYKFTDKTGKGQLRTSHVVLKGWPATIFCTTEAKYIEDLATRGWTITPEMSQEKYSEANMLTAKFDANPFTKSLTFQTEDVTEYVALRDYIKYVLSIRARQRVSRTAAKVVVPYAEKLAEIYPAKISRDMRDFKRFLSLIKVNALLNRYNRPILVLRAKDRFEDFVIAINEDLYIALEIFQNMAETTRTGIPRHIIEFYNQIIEPLCEDGPKHYDDFTKAYNEKFESSISTKTVKRWCDLLEDVGWIDKSPDPEDKRRILISPIRKNSDILDLSKFKNFFTPENFKEWFYGLQKYRTQNPSECKILLKLREEDSEIDKVDENDLIIWEKIVLYFSFDFQGLKEKIGNKKAVNTEREDLSKFLESSKKFEIQIDESQGIRHWELWKEEKPPELGSLRDKIQVVLEVLEEMQREYGIAKRDELTARLSKEHDIPSSEVEEILGMLIREGKVFEPRIGYLKKT